MTSFYVESRIYYIYADQEEHFGERNPVHHFSEYVDDVVGNQFLNDPNVIAWMETQVITHGDWEPNIFKE